MSGEAEATAQYADLSSASGGVNDSNGVGSWEAAGEGLKSMKPESQTQLAVISTTEADNGDVSIRLFYQSASLELRQASNDGEKVKWSDAALSSGGGTFKIPRGSSLAATATDTSRLFYQAANRGIEVLKENGCQWRLTAPVLSEESDAEGRINLYFVDRNKTLLPRLLDTDQDEWVAGYPSDIPTERLHKGSALAAASPTEGETSAFFQSAEKTIAQYSEEVQAKLPLGITRSRSGNAEAPCKRVDKANVSEFEEFGILGLVRRQTIDRMDEETRERLKQRLSYTVKHVRSYRRGIQALIYLILAVTLLGNFSSRPFMLLTLPA
ncbi:hypothetical protein LCI18_015304 [Fusarium solani-melongenae]|uniref:Uncharacterized protein n=1 Tax=Fusarium solani subsp. cucurbitae TaxID=2747967 RepID=A0ACD3ZSQ6_FUSSC|nr:hypothetical protein LCI18_015304 [Fusarium solani-melongenae]